MFNTKPSDFIVQIKETSFKYSTNYFDVNTWLDNPFSKIKHSLILDNISVSVPKGCIYALLGSNGCGKTTLLKCILGLHSPHQGEVTVFGTKPGSKNCPVPGPRVGYMPQEISLPNGFTIRQILLYFGLLKQISPSQMTSQFEFLVDLLKLPTDDRLFEKLSGGQQRRVSLACALLGLPSLLILDEPTVGVDPLLRDIIWKHLTLLCTQKGVTVILTTHYIEEARSADVISFLRKGRLLVEDSPSKLLAEHQESQIEQVFLKLSELQDAENFDGQNEIQNKSEPVNFQQTKCSKKLSTFKLYRVKAVFLKNKTYFSQSLLTTFFNLLAPTLIISFSFYTYVSGPKNLSIAIVNDESRPNLTTDFFSHQNFEVVNPIKMNSLDEALSCLTEGKITATVHFFSNYSEAFKVRQTLSRNIDNETIKASNLHLYLDMTNYVVGATAIANVFQALQTMLKTYFASSNQNPHSLSVPITITEVVYGSLDFGEFSKVIIPDLMLFYVFFIMGVGTSLLLVTEKKSGLYERIRVLGVTYLEFLTAHFFTQLVFVLGQSLPLFVYVFVHKEFPSKGSYLTVYLIYVLNGIAGIVYGILLAVIFNDLVSISCIYGGSILAVLVLSGIFWPFECIPVFFQFVGLLFPMPLSVRSQKYVMIKGWHLTNPSVLLGLVSTGIWIFVCLCIIFFVSKRQVSN